MIGDDSVPQPVMIEVVRECAFVAKPCGLCGLPKSNRAHSPKKTATCRYKRQNGCATCGAAKSDERHFGEPPSLNFFSFSGLTGPLLSSSKQAWQKLLLDRLRASALPTGLSRVYVSGEVTFPVDARRRDGEYNRDQGNFRVLIEKALGDALEEGGYLPSDGWDRYEFGDLAQRVVAGESATRLTIFPMIFHGPEQMELTR